jgi:MoaA/NifB/PqqE/SkfB family radical SAM enzyme
MAKNDYNFPQILLKIRNNIVKVIPENTRLFKQLCLIGFRINARKNHAARTSMTMGVYAAQHCNLNCRCCTAFSPIAQEAFLDIESYKKDMAKLSALTGKKLDAFYITGGEPLLHPRLLEIFDIARVFFPETALGFMTNGLLLLKMPEAFWENCGRNKVAINVSRYPVKLDLAKIRELTKTYHVMFDYVGGSDVPVKAMWKYPLDLEGAQPLARSFNICTQVNRCITMKDGYIYPCNTIAGIEHFNARFNTKLEKKLELTADDVLELNTVKNINEVYEFLSKPKPFCRYCNRKGVVFGIPYGQSKKELSEWV